MQQSFYQNDDLSILELSMQDLISTLETQQKSTTDFVDESNGFTIDTDALSAFSDTNIDHLYF